MQPQSYKKGVHHCVLPFLLVTEGRIDFHPQAQHAWPKLADHLNTHPSCLSGLTIKLKGWPSHNVAFEHAILGGTKIWVVSCEAKSQEPAAVYFSCQDDPQIMLFSKSLKIYTMIFASANRFRAVTKADSVVRWKQTNLAKLCDKHGQAFSDNTTTLIAQGHRSQTWLQLSRLHELPGCVWGVL